MIQQQIYFQNYVKMFNKMERTSQTAIQIKLHLKKQQIQTLFTLLFERCLMLLTNNLLSFIHLIHSSPSFIPASYESLLLSSLESFVRIEAIHSLSFHI